MGLEFNLANAGGRQARKAATNNTGIRRITKNAIEAKQDEAGGLIGFLWNGFSRFGNFIINVVMKSVMSFLAFSFTLLASLIVTTFQFVWNFDWNITDETAQQQINAAWQQVLTSGFGVIGRGLGSLVCGAGGAGVIAMFNPAAAVYAFTVAGEEALEDFAQALTQFIQLTARVSIQTFLTYAYVNIRSLVRKSDPEYANQLMDWGIPTDIRVQLLKERDKPWTFASASESLMKKYVPEWLQQPVENLVEEFGDACQDMVLMLGQGLDAFFAKQKLANEATLGAVTTVEIEFNRSDPPTPPPTTP